MSLGNPSKSFEKRLHHRAHKQSRSVPPCMALKKIRIYHRENFNQKCFYSPTDPLVLSFKFPSYPKFRHQFNSSSKINEIRHRIFAFRFAKSEPCYLSIVTLNCCHTRRFFARFYGIQCLNNTCICRTTQLQQRCQSFAKHNKHYKAGWTRSRSISDLPSKIRTLDPTSILLCAVSKYFSVAI